MATSSKEFCRLSTPTAAARVLRFATWSWCLGAVIYTPGCRAVDNAQVDVLERDLRQQEDYIYELEDYLMQYSEKLRQCRSCQATAPAPTAARADARPMPVAPCT